MKTLTALLVALLITSCASLDNLGLDTSRTDIQKVTFAVESMPYDQLAIKCAQWPYAVACTTSTGVYVQGKPRRTVITFTARYLNWADLGDKCGRFTGAGVCMENGILYTSSRYRDEYHIAAIGDLIDEAFNLGLGFNRRAQLGHEIVVHVLDTDASDPWYSSGTQHISRF